MIKKLLAFLILITIALPVFAIAFLAGIVAWALEEIFE